MSLEQPNYYNWQDRRLYDELSSARFERELTEEEEYFCRSMYHMEEVACGLDG